MTPTFAQDGIAVSVDAPDDDLTWLSEFLEPAFAVVSAGPADVRIAFDKAAGPYLDGPHTHTRTLFVLDSGPLSLPAAAITGGTRVYDAAERLTIEVTDGGRRVCIRYHGSRLDARVRLLRVVREYAHNHSLSIGGVMLHAAAVTVEGVAIAIAGAKGIGKTTVALRILQVPGVGYLSNDRVLVRTDEPQALAIPTVIALKIGTRALLPDLTRRLQNCGDFREHAEERRARGSMPPVSERDVWHISPHQLCAALDRRPQAAAPLAAILFPIGERSLSTLMHRLTPVQGTTALHEALLCRQSGHYTSDLFVTSPTCQPSAETLRAACDSLAARVPCMVSRLPDDSTIEDLAAVVASLCGHPGRRRVEW
jgi:hypothetical protein